MNRKLTPIYAACAVLLLTGLTCDNQEEEIRNVTTRFYQAILDWNADAAYGMLSSEARFNISRRDFEEMITFGLPQNLNNRTFRKAWSDATNFTIDEIEIKRNRALVTVTFNMPDMETILERLNQKALNDKIEVKYRGKQEKIDQWYAREIAEVIEKRQFTRTRETYRTWLVRESGQWFITDYAYED